MKMKNLEDIEAISGPFTDTVIAIQGEGKAFPEAVKALAKAWVIGLGEDPNDTAGAILVDLILQSLFHVHNIFVRPPYGALYTRDPVYIKAVATLKAKGLIETKGEDWNFKIRLAHSTRVFKQK